MDVDSNRYGKMQIDLLKSVGFDTESVSSMVRKIFHRFANTDGTMDREGFGNFLRAYPKLIEKDSGRIDNYFRAFDDRYSNHLLFNQFRTGLAALDPRTDHGRNCGEIRSRYVFRFYCRDHSVNAIMNNEEFATMAKDIVKKKEPAVANNMEEVNKLAGPYFRHFEVDQMTIDKFLSKVGTLQLRGTSELFRSTVPVLPVISDGIVKKEPTDGAVVEMECEDDGSHRSISVQSETNFEVSHYCVYVTTAGCVTERLADMGGASSSFDAIGTVSQTTASILRQQLPDGRETPSGRERKRAVSCASDFLRGLDYFYRPYAIKSKPIKPITIEADSTQANQYETPPQQQLRKPALDWCDVKRPKLASCLVKLCEYLRPILADEPRCLELKQPIYILGDLHGDYEDLHEFERLFWPMGPENCLADILCLGDYVDRGVYGMEVISYLFALKVIAPTKVFLLRGNHEMREQQEAFQFKAECLEKFGQIQGARVWEAVNTCFDLMPLAAVIDRKIFCAHGGIPHPRYLQRIPDVPQDNLVALINAACACPAEKFLYESLPWELLWNDPVWDDNPMAFDQYGFRVNKKRGTGHEFSYVALEAFLKRFNLSHLIRAHQVQNAGFQLRYNAKCLTVFSSSMYSGLENEAAVVIVNGDSIKLTRVSLKTAQSGLYEKENEEGKGDQASSSYLTRKDVGLFAKR